MPFVSTNRMRSKGSTLSAPDGSLQETTHGHAAHSQGALWDGHGAAHSSSSLSSLSPPVPGTANQRKVAGDPSFSSDSCTASGSTGPAPAPAALSVGERMQLQMQQLESDSRQLDREQQMLQQRWNEVPSPGLSSIQHQGDAGSRQHHSMISSSSQGQLSEQQQQQQVAIANDAQHAARGEHGSLALGTGYQGGLPSAVDVRRQAMQAMLQARQTLETQGSSEGSGMAELAAVSDGPSGVVPTGQLPRQWRYHTDALADVEADAMGARGKLACSSAEASRREDYEQSRDLLSSAQAQQANVNMVRHTGMAARTVSSPRQGRWPAREGAPDGSGMGARDTQATARLPGPSLQLTSEADPADVRFVMDSASSNGTIAHDHSF